MDLNEPQAPGAGEPPAPPEFLLGEAQVQDFPHTTEDTIKQILHWIGFRTEASRQDVFDDAFESFEYIKNLTDKDISTMSTSFSSRTQANGRINFGTSRTKLLKAFTHWVQDFFRVSEIPSIIGLSEMTFKAQLDRALARANIRKMMKDKTKTSAEAASPGPLENEKQWKHWEEKFINYAKAHMGSNGVPLSYVIRENEDPDVDGNHSDFISKTVACAPLSGEYYSADRMSVFDMLVAFTTGQPSGDWIKSSLKHSDGRRSMNELRRHFAGEGNATRNMAEAERMNESLHYKNERAVSFETFLNQCQKMFIIYEKEGEPMSDEAKVRFLFRKVQHASLRSSIDALKAQQTAGTDITYTMAANHLSTAVSELPEYISKNSRNVSGVQRDGKDGKGSDAIYNADGTINTGRIHGWHSLSFKDKKIVYDERKRQGITPKLKYSKGRSNDSHHSAGSASDLNRMKQLKDQNSKYKRQIKALRTRAGADEADDAEDAEVPLDAGDQFGGKAAKKKKVSFK
jgi:hypothetical protein